MARMMQPARKIRQEPENPLKAYFMVFFCAAGIYSAYLTQGLVQERLQTHTYGPHKERFPELTFLQGAQGLACFLVGAVLLFFGKLLGLIPSGDHPVSPRAHDDKNADVRPKGILPNIDEYLKCAVTNTIGPACGILALRNISYPAQVLAKSCKPLAVMLSGAIFYRKKYSAVEYGCVSLVAAGISLFAFNGSSHAAKKLQHPNALLGYSLCAINLLLDGFTNANQDDITHHFPTVTPLHLMTWINFWMSVLAGYVYFLAGNSGWKIIDFCQRHPEALKELAMFCACGAFGQLFIFLSIRTFGSLTNTTITTTRKFFNILLSVMWNGTVLVPSQWLGSVMVLGGLLVQAIYKDQMKKRARSKEAKATQASRYAPEKAEEVRAKTPAKKEEERGRARTPRTNVKSAAKRNGNATPSRSPVGRKEEAAPAQPEPEAVKPAAGGRSRSSRRTKKDQ